MFDEDRPVEVGKLRGDFLTDHAGHRIYFPMLGPARLVPSPEEEAKLRSLMIWALVVPVVLGIGAAAALIILPERSISTSGEWVALAFIVRGLITSCFARRWPEVPTTEYSYALYVVQTHERRGLASLIFAILLRAAASVGFGIVPVWLAVHYPFDWADLTMLEKIARAVSPLLLTLLSPYFALSTYRAASVLWKRLRPLPA